ncbi:matrixin family metalloprotease [Metabacillus sp. Hm71]|uniref:matrixin family metalloprotease n=1 Tax=Metabacillus sp. Hm71 TaxID=3450743 RepID=UPI003F4205E0
MKAKLYTLVIGALVFTMLLVPTSTKAHFLGYDSVDDGEIRYGDETGYNNAISHARSQWNSVGRINIAPDDSWVYEDVTYMSTTRNDVTWAGLYTNTSGADEIYFNKKYMVPYGDRKEEIVGIHETGHALGLAHSYSGQVMAKYVSDMAHTPQSHDKSDYHSLW